MSSTTPDPPGAETRVDHLPAAGPARDERDSDATRLVPPRQPEQADTVRFAYFLVQAQVQRSSQRPGLRALLEDLSTGEKRTFGSGRALGRFLDRWGGVEDDDDLERFRDPREEQAR